MKATAPRLYGLVAEFPSADALIAAANQTREAGYRRIDAYSPFPIHGLAEAIGFHRSRLPLVVLLGGILGGCGAFFMEWFSATIHYPINVGGRPLNSWPAFIPVTFELTVLGAAVAAVLGMIVMNGLPMPYHPLFNVERFGQASRDRFFLCIESRDPKFDLEATKRFLESLKPMGVYEAEP
jgi:Alternative complex III, ActD subunit